MRTLITALAISAFLLQAQILGPILYGSKPPKAPASVTYYVSPTGSDNADGMSPATAWATVARVSEFSFNPGDSVLFERGGTWFESMWPVTLYISSDGEDGSPITYGAYGSGASPQLRNIVIDGRSYISVSELSVVDSPQHGIIIDKSDHITLDGVTVDGAADTGIAVGNGSSYVSILNSTVSNNGSGDSGDRDGIAIGNSGSLSHHVTVDGCTIEGNWHDNIRISMTSGLETPHDIVVRNNVIRNSTTGAAVAMDAVEACLIHHNVMTGNQLGVYVVPANLGEIVENVTAGVYHNTLYGNGAGILLTHGAGGTFMVTLKNNILAENGVGQYPFEMMVTIPYGWASDYNLVYHSAGGNFMYAGEPMNWATWRSTIAPNDANSLNVNPLFTDAGSGDFTLQPDSLARGAGVYVEGVSKTNPPNIGAR